MVGARSTMSRPSVGTPGTVHEEQRVVVRVHAGERAPAEHLGARQRALGVVAVAKWRTRSGAAIDARPAVELVAREDARHRPPARRRARAVVVQREQPLAQRARAARRPPPRRRCRAGSAPRGGRTRAPGSRTNAFVAGSMSASPFGFSAAEAQQPALAQPRVRVELAVDQRVAVIRDDEQRRAARHRRRPSRRCTSSSRR